MISLIFGMDFSRDFKNVKSSISFHIQMQEEYAHPEQTEKSITSAHFLRSN